MKFRSIILTALAAVAVFASCQKPEEPLKAPSVSLNPATLTLEENAAEETVALTATRAWKVEGDLPEWITITPDRGDGSNEAQPLKVKVTKNEAGNRTAKIKFTIGLFDATLKVDQKGPKGDVIETITIEEFLAKKDKVNELTIHGVPVGKISFPETKGGFYGFNIEDETGTIACAFPKNMVEYKETLKEGTLVYIQGKWDEHEGQPQLKNGTILKIGEPNFPPVLNAALADVAKAGPCAKVSTNEVFVVGTHAQGYMLYDGTTFLMAFAKGAHEIKVGDQVVVSGIRSRYNGIPQINEPEVEVKSHDNAFNLGDPLDITANFKEYTSTTNTYITFEGKLEVGSYINIFVDGVTDRDGSVAYADEALKAELNKYNGNKVKVTGFFLGGTKHMQLMVTDIEPAGAFISTQPTSLAFDAKGGEKTVTVSASSADWTYNCPDANFTVTKAGEGLKVVAAANGTDALRESEITLTLGDKTATIGLVQYKAGDLNFSTIDWTKVTSNNKVYDATLVIDGVEYPGKKLGTGDSEGTITIPGSELKDGTMKFTAAAWNGEGEGIWTITAAGCTIDGKASYQYIAKANDGVSGRGPKYTIVPAAENNYSVTLAGVSAESSLTFTWTADTAEKNKKTNKRMIIWGVQFE